MFDPNKIWKYLQQHLNEKEMTAVENWINASNSNREEFFEIKRIWEAANHLDESILVDDNWDEFEKLIPDQPNPSKVLKLRWIGYAASFLLVTSLILWLFLPKKAELYQSYTAVAQDETLLLPDSSIITLDINSTVKYYTRIEENFQFRRIFVDGGATFDITPNDKLPFVVELDKTGVKVLGTVFRIEERDSNDVSVQNIEGQIKFFELNNVENAVIIEAGEHYSYDGESFKDTTPIPEPKPLPKQEKVKSKINIYTIEKVIDILFKKFDGKFNTGSYGYFDMNSKVRLNMNNSLDDIILQLMGQADVVYRKTCENCYEIQSIKVRKSK